MSDVTIIARCSSCGCPLTLVSGQQGYCHRCGAWREAESVKPGGKLAARQKVEGERL